MRASLTIGGIEVALVIPSGDIETALAEKYSQFLGATEDPACLLAVEVDTALLSPSGEESLQRLTTTAYQVSQSGFSGRFDLAGESRIRLADADALDKSLRVLFAMLAPRHEGVLLTGTAVLGEQGVDVFMAPRPSGLALVKRERSAWRATSTPFLAPYERVGGPREGELRTLWCELSLEKPLTDHGPAAALRLIAEHAVTPADPELWQRTVRLIEDISHEIPLAQYRFSHSAGVPAGLAEPFLTS